jgi:hypothetical protein
LDKNKSGFGSGSAEQNSKTSAREDLYPSTDPEETAQKKNYRPLRGGGHGKSSSPLAHEAAPIGRYLSTFRRNLLPNLGLFEP